jgi:hypothetical protein
VNGKPWARGSVGVTFVRRPRLADDERRICFDARSERVRYASPALEPGWGPARLVRAATTCYLSAVVVGEPALPEPFTGVLAWARTAPSQRR